MRTVTAVQPVAQQRMSAARKPRSDLVCSAGQNHNPQKRHTVILLHNLIFRYTLLTIRIIPAAVIAGIFAQGKYHTVLFLFKYARNSCQIFLVQNTLVSLCG